MAMKLETPIIAVLIASMFFFGLSTMFNGMARNYQDAGLMSIDDSLGLQVNNGTISIDEALDRLNESKESIDKVNDNFKSLQVTDLNSLWTFLKSVWGSGQILIDALIAPRDVLVAIGQIIGLDPSIILTLFSILMFILIITLILILAGRVVG